jgi:putative tricarboxylic transport membrane protein
MGDFFAYKYSTSHYFFPKIVIAILIVLGLIIVIPKIIKAIKNKEHLFKGKRFFIENYDKVKLVGSIVLLALYILALEWIHFLAASLIFIFLFNVLYCGFKWKSLIVSGTISAISVITVWLVFGVAFNVTLP